MNGTGLELFRFSSFSSILSVLGLAHSLYPFPGFVSVFQISSGLCNIMNILSYYWLCMDINVLYQVLGAGWINQAFVSAVNMA